eukprot:TRINITY_DN13472_c0_g1_i1.p1 TRINITY_DN13472_c0_g1~~TRINITY_DN13472_c0_g1_i1.p1  ORF type:complete len:272 (-),score=18.56 TRINITY_DN13472_c0_g1_i1:259-1074(-)
MRAPSMPGTGEHESTSVAFGSGTATFYVALLGKREMVGMSFGRHWAVGLFNASGNVVLHMRNRELRDSMPECGRSLRSVQRKLRISSWNTSHLCAYRGIMFAKPVTIDLDTLRAIADSIRDYRDCQDYALRLIMLLGIDMVGWLWWAECFNSVGNVVNVPLREKMTICTPLKLTLTFGLMSLKSSWEWDDCNVFFEGIIEGLATYWTVPEQTEDTDRSLCCICLERPREHACVPCGHLCLCGEDLVTLLERTAPQCPICRADVDTFVRIFQ